MRKPKSKPRMKSREFLDEFRMDRDNDILGGSFIECRTASELIKLHHRIDSLEDRLDEKEEKYKSKLQEPARNNTTIGDNLSNSDYWELQI